MRGTISKFLLLVFVGMLWFPPQACLATSGKRLLTINDVEYTDEDFKNWWKHWNDKDVQKFPATPDEFIDFQLMVQQGREMGYDTNPNYLHKLDVFLQVRAMMALKYEEVDSKAIVDDADIKEFFEDNYSYLWLLQILGFDSETKARKAYEYMTPFNGKVAGRLAFADIYGGNAEEKAETYDEVKVSVADFHKNKMDAWLPIVRKLAPGEVAAPFYFADRKKYILVRMVESQKVGDDVFEAKKKSMTEVLYKNKKGRLTAELLEKLKVKYNVVVDKELFAEVKLDGNYQKDFLGRSLLRMNNFEATVNDLIYNSIKEKSLRKNVPDDAIKAMVLDNIITQTLINKESLARGYETRPPLKATYEFYKQNRLKAEVEAGLMSSVAVSDEDVRNYYKQNVGIFSVPDKYSFVLLEGDKDTLNKIWVATLQGGSLNELAQKYSLDAHTQSQAENLLSPIVVAEMKKLDKGGVGVPFLLDGKYGMLQLIDRFPGEVRPFELVKNQIFDQLKKDKFEINKVQYLGKLRSRSQIDINERAWKGLERELSNGKED